MIIIKNLSFGMLHWNATWVVHVLLIPSFSLCLFDDSLSSFHIFVGLLCRRLQYIFHGMIVNVNVSDDALNKVEWKLFFSIRVKHHTSCGYYFVISFLLLIQWTGSSILGICYSTHITTCLYWFFRENKLLLCYICWCSCFSCFLHTRNSDLMFYVLRLHLVFYLPVFS